MERWKVCAQFPSHEVSTLGKIRNSKTHNTLTCGHNPKGYVTVNIKNKIYLAHRIVASTWIPNINKKPTVDHINGIRDDNRVCNLRWATMKEQRQNQHKRYSSGPKRPVNKICIQTNEIIETFPSIMQATRCIGQKASSGNIYNACIGKLKTAYGYIWEFVPDRICEGEEWVNITFEPTYQISSFGRVKTPKGIIKDFIHKNRSNQTYPKIGINGKVYPLHKLVGDHFLEKNYLKPNINHKDGDKWNPHKDNLEWCTQSENMIHAIKMGKNPCVTKVDCINTITGEKRSFRSMKHASVTLGYSSGWLCKKFRKNERNVCQHKEYKFLRKK